MQRPFSVLQGQNKPWASRPRINWSHPLARGLSTYCYDWNGQIIDLVNPGPAATFVGASGTKGSVVGAGLKIPLLGFGALPPLPQGKFLPFGGAAPYSAWLATVNTGATNTSGNPDPDGVIVAVQDAGNSLNTAFGFNCWSAGTHSAFDAVSGLYNNNLNAWYNTPLALNKFQTWGVSAPTTTTANQYAGGVFDSTFSNTTTSSAVSNCQIMYNTAQTGSQLFGQAVQGFVPAFAMWYPRVLTANDWRELHLRPWAPYGIPLLIYPEDEVLSRRIGLKPAAGGVTLTAAQGSFTETGEPVVFAEKMPAAQGSFTLTGEAAGLVQGTVFTSAQGSFALTGEASFFKEVMPAIEGSFVLTGEAANLVQGTALTGAQGSYVLTGEPALFPEKMPAAQGSFTLTGEPATLSATSGSTLTAAFGAFTLTGEAAGLVQGTVFTAAQGAYVLTGEAALFAEVMPAAFGSYVLTGEPATLSGTSSNSLTAAFGSFTLTGEGALFAEAMPAAQGSFALTGEAAGLVQGTVFTAAQGSFVLTGEPVTFTLGTSVLAAATGHYVLTGHAATLTATGQAAAPLPTMKPYQPRAYPQIAPGIPMWHTGQNNDISSSVASLIETIKTLDARLRTGGL